MSLIHKFAAFRAFARQAGALSMPSIGYLLISRSSGCEMMSKALERAPLVHIQFFSADFIRSNQPVVFFSADPYA